MAKNNTFTCGNMNITSMVIGPIETNVYVVFNEAGAFVVDPADDCARIERAVDAAVATVAADVGATAADAGAAGSGAGATAAADVSAAAGSDACVASSGAGSGAGIQGKSRLDAIVVTHAHFDHTGALAQLRLETQAPVIASVLDAPAIENPQASASSSLPPVKKCTVDRRVADGDILELCGARWQVLATPGHTPGSMCLYLPASENGGKEGVLISGDTLFKGAFGRTDFPGGSMAAMQKSLHRLEQLPANTLVLPGHMQFTEIGAESSGVFRLIG